jgi:hypothetical protein
VAAAILAASECGFQPHTVCQRGGRVKLRPGISDLGSEGEFVGRARSPLRAGLSDGHVEARRATECPPYLNPCSSVVFISPTFQEHFTLLLQSFFKPFRAIAIAARSFTPPSADRRKWSG